MHIQGKPRKAATEQQRREGFGGVLCKGEGAGEHHSHSGARSFLPRDVLAIQSMDYSTDVLHMRLLRLQELVRLSKRIVSDKPVGAHYVSSLRNTPPAAHLGQFSARTKCRDCDC
jgi:hypothetical protein